MPRFPKREKTMQAKPKLEPIADVARRVLHHSSCLKELDDVEIVTPEHLDLLKQSVTSLAHQVHEETPATATIQHVEEFLEGSLEKTYSWQDDNVNFTCLSVPKQHLPSPGEKPSTVALLPEFDRLWTTNYANLKPKYDLNLPSHLRRGVLCVDSVAGERAAKLILAPPPVGVDVLNYMRATWNSPGLFFEQTETVNSSFDVTTAQRKPRIAVWRTMIFWLLHHRPQSVAQVLEATYTHPHPPFYMVADALEHLASYYLQDSDKFTPVAAESFRTALYHLLRECVEARTYISQKTIFLVLTRSTLQGTHFFYNLLTNLNVHVSSDSLLQFAYFFGMQGDFERALDALADAIQAGANPSSDAVLSLCNKILRWSVVNPDGYHASAYIVSRLLEVGVHMNLPLHNVLMANAVEADDVKMALRVFDLLEENGVEPNAYTYCTLLKGCKQSSDHALTSNILKKASEVALATQNARIATDILHVVHLQRLKQGESELGATANEPDFSAIYGTLLRVYLRYFDARILLELRVISRSLLHHHMNELNLTPSRMKPTPAAVNIMLTAYLRLSRANVEGSFKRFTKALLGGGTDITRDLAEDITKLAMTDYTYNVYLWAFSRKKEYLQHCTALVHLMGQGLPPVLLPRDPLTDRPIPPAKPTAQTFSILLEAFARHGQTAAAMKVLNLMRQRGLKPTEVTWNTLVKGYAAARDVEGMAGALRGLEKDGFKVNDAVVAAFRKVGGKDALMKAWENQKRLEDEGLWDEAYEQEDHEAYELEESVYATETYGFDGKELGLEPPRHNKGVDEDTEETRFGAHPLNEEMESQGNDIDYHYFEEELEPREDAFDEWNRPPTMVSFDKH
jgi:pentatricopeptide repeat protein